MNDRSILERDTEILRSVRLNDKGRLDLTPIKEVSRIQVSSIAPDSTRKCDHRRKKIKR